MNYLLSDHKDFAAAYHDDILLFSRSGWEHFKHEVSIHLEKCVFMKSEVYVRVNEHGLRPLQKNIDDVSFRTPTNVDEFRRFLTMAEFYKNFIPHFAEIAQPLFELLTKKKEEFL